MAEEVPGQIRRTSELPRARTRVREPGETNGEKSKIKKTSLLNIRS